MTPFPPPPAPTRGGRTGAVLIGTGVVGALVLSFLPAPYAIERPGPVFDTLGEVTVGQGTDDEERVPLISIPDETTYPTGGSLSLLTVNVVGNREERPTWIDVAAAWGDPSRAVVPLDAVYPPGESLEQSNRDSAVDMRNSQREAVAAALSELGYEFGSDLTVADLAAGSPSRGLLAAGDRILAVDGTRPDDVSGLRALVAAGGTGAPVRVERERDGAAETVEVVPEEGPDGAPVLGITVSADYDFPVEVDIRLDDVGGPSAGMMFALGIVDKLTEGELTGGAEVAGTGTIDGGGAVGPIGGIRQKLYGASGAGADVFLAPTANCDEVTGHVPDGLEVFAVDSLDAALRVMDGLRDGDTAGLPSCPAP